MTKLKDSRVRTREKKPLTVKQIQARLKHGSHFIVAYQIEGWDRQVAKLTYGQVANMMRDSRYKIYSMKKVVQTHADTVRSMSLD